MAKCNRLRIRQNNKVALIRGASKDEKSDSLSENIISTKLDIFEPRNVIKILLCFVFTFFVIFEMVRGFLFSDIVTAANKIRYGMLNNDITIEYLGIENKQNYKEIIAKLNNKSIRNYWAVVIDIDLYDKNNNKLDTIRIGTENVLSETEFIIEEKIDDDRVEQLKLIRIDGIENSKY